MITNKHIVNYHLKRQDSIFIQNCIENLPFKTEELEKRLFYFNLKENIIIEDSKWYIL